MKNKLKKGFTIVELVIVIAVIAILAAVLIPTFSSITNSARESAALQEAKSGSETILALTTGTLPEKSAFLVADDEESDTNDYTFVFYGQKIQNVSAVTDYGDIVNACSRDDVVASDGKKKGYIVYVSTKALTSANDQVTNGPINVNVANRILSAIGVTATVTDGTDNNYTVSASRDYAMWSFTEGDNTYYFNIYWTSDFNPTLIAFMGGNVAGGGTEVETVNVTATGATVDKTTVEKGKDANLVLTLPSEGTPYAAYYTVTVGEFTTDVKQVDGTLTVTIPSQNTVSDFNITVKKATVTVTISNGNVGGEATVEVAKGEETTLEITPTGATGTTYGVTVGSGEEVDIALNEGGKLSVTLTADQTQNNITISIMKK